MNNSSQNRIFISTPHMGGGELSYIKEAMDANCVAPVGANIDGFEQDLELYQGQQSHVAALSSGTAAIHLALIQAGVGPGDEVLC